MADGQEVVDAYSGPAPNYEVSLTVTTYQKHVQPLPGSSLISATTTNSVDVHTGEINTKRKLELDIIGRTAKFTFDLGSSEVEAQLKRGPLQ